MTRGCVVTGVELDPEAARAAARDLRRVVVADLDRVSLAGSVGPETFDVVVLADVLEHLKDPGSVLREAALMLAPGGRVVLSVPNVGHGSLRLALLQGRWNYTDTGLLDRTHRHFFTRQTLLELVTSAGLVVTELRGTVADPLEVEVEVDPQSVPAGAVDWVRKQADALVYQFQLAAVPADGHDSSADQTEIQLRPAAAAPGVAAARWPQGARLGGGETPQGVETHRTLTDWWS